MLDARIYRAALVPVALALIVCAFSLGERPRPIRTTLAPDAFSVQRSLADLAALAALTPPSGARRPGDAADAAMATTVADALRAMSSYQVSTPTFSGETIDGERRLTTVIARQVGAPGPGVVVVAHRDAAGRGERARLTGTAALLELARVVAGGRLRRTVTFASTSGGSGGAAGARDLVRRLGAGVDAVLVLGDLGGTHARRPFVSGWSADRGLAPLQLQRTVEAAVRTEAGADPGRTHPIVQWVRLGFGHTVGEQGPFVAAGLPAVLLSVSGERGPGAGDRVVPERLGTFGRAALRAVVALDTGPAVPRGTQTDLVILRKVLPSWAVRLLVGTLLLAPVLVVIDGFARARRRREPVGRSLRWIAATALPFVMACAFAGALGVTGLISAAPPMPVGAGAIPFDTSAKVAMVAVALVLVLGWLIVRPAALGRQPREPTAPARATALVLTWCGLAVILWALNPFAAAFLVPAAHAWLLLAASQVRLSRAAAMGLVVAPLVPLALVGLVLAAQLGVDPLGLAWVALLGVAGGWVGPSAWLLWSAVAACAVAALALAWRTTNGPGTDRGDLRHAGPGSLGGTESALRR